MVRGIDQVDRKFSEKNQSKQMTEYDDLMDPILDLNPSPLGLKFKTLLRKPFPIFEGKN